MSGKSLGFLIKSPFKETKPSSDEIILAEGGERTAAPRSWNSSIESVLLMNLRVEVIIDLETAVFSLIA